MSKEKSAAILTIYGAPDMTPEGRKDIAEWLRLHAKMLVKDGSNYARGRFTGRYLYKEGE